MRKLLLLVFLFTVSFSSISYAVNKFNYESALQIANEYIANSNFDENWKDHNPKILEKGKNYFTDNDSSVSYIEFKVSCDNNPDCGFIMVNYDGNDVTIPVSSTNGNTPSEILLAQNKGTIESNKLYYFSPFDMYGENTQTEEVSSIDPVDNIDQKLDNNEKLTKEEKQEKRKQLKTKLREKIKLMKKEAGDYKKSDDFKNKIKELREKKQSIPENELGYKILPFTNAIDYVLPGTSDKFIPSSVNYSSAYCSGLTPCYSQFRQNYSGTNGDNCLSGCGPTAVAILYGYYDKNGFPNLIPGTAPDYGTGIIVQALQNSLRNYMGTICDDNHEGATGFPNEYKAKDYAINKGYSKSSAKYVTGTISSIFSTIKTEINAGRPVIVNVGNSSGGHIVVGFGYKSTGTSYIVRMNMGWGGIGYYTSNGIKYYHSNLDQDLNAVYYNSSNNKKVISITTFKISN